MSEFFGILGNLSEDGLVKVVGCTTLALVATVVIVCSSGCDLEIGKGRISIHKHFEGQLPVHMSIYHNEETA